MRPKGADFDKGDSGYGNGVLSYMRKSSRRYCSELSTLRRDVSGWLGKA